VAILQEGVELGDRLEVGLHGPLGLVLGPEMPFEGTGKVDYSGH